MPTLQLSIIQVFLEETPQDMYSLEQAIAAENHTLIYQAAHKIKPNVDLLRDGAAHIN